MDRKRVFIHSEDPELALKLVKLLDRHGVTALWVTQEQGEQIERLWRVDARVRTRPGGERHGLNPITAFPQYVIVCHCRWMCSM